MNWPLLSLLRFFLALIVVFTHFWLIVGTGHPLSIFIHLSAPVAVLAFFFISGLSIRCSLRRNPAGFYARRAWRIMPEFMISHMVVWLALGLAAGVIIFPGGGMLEIEGSLRSLFLLIAHYLPVQTILLPAQSWNGPAWSLGIEVLYYAVAPFLLCLSPLFVRLMAAASLVFYLLYPSSLTGDGSLKWVPALWWIWLCGWIYADEDSSHHVRSFCLIAPLLFLRPEFSLGMHYAMVPLCVLFLCVNNGNALSFSTQVARVANWLGDFSYTVYIAHTPAMLLMIALFGEPSWLLAVCGVFIVCLLVHEAANLARGILRDRKFITRPMAMVEN